VASQRGAVARQHGGETVLSWERVSIDRYFVEWDPFEATFSN